VLSIQPSTSILSEKALAALKYAFLQNKKVGIAGVRVDSLKPPSESDLSKAQAAYSIAQNLVDWSEKFIIDDESPKLQDDEKPCLEIKDDEKACEIKDDEKACLEIKDDEKVCPEIKYDQKEIKDEPLDTKDDKIESCSKFPYFETTLDIMSVKTEPVGYSDFRLPASPTAFTALNTSKAAETLDFLKDTGFDGFKDTGVDGFKDTSCDGFDFFKSGDIGINFLGYPSHEPMDSLDDLNQQTVDIDFAFPVPPLPTVYSKMDSDPDLTSPIASPNSPFLFSPLSPHTPSRSF
jgi:hypothetical protein